MITYNWYLEGEALEEEAEELGDYELSQYREED